MHFNRHGVSPVIGIILLVAVTVVMSTVLFFMVQNTSDQAETISAQIGVTTYVVDNEHWILSIAAVSGPLDPHSAIIQLQRNGVALEGYNDDLMDVQSTLDNPTSDSNMTWHDNNNNTKVDPGDSFIINRYIDGGSEALPDGDYQFLFLTPEGKSLDKSLSNY